MLNLSPVLEDSIEKYFKIKLNRYLKVSLNSQNKDALITET